MFHIYAISLVFGKNRRRVYDISNYISNYLALIAMRAGGMGLLPDTWNCGLRMRRECREHFSRHHGLVIPTCITARASSTVTSGFLLSRWRGKLSRHSRHMRNPQFYVSGNRPMESMFISKHVLCVITLEVFVFKIVSCWTVILFCTDGVWGPYFI